MALLVLLQLLSAAPTVALSAESSCAPREVLRRELGATFVEQSAVVLRLEQDGKLTLEKEGRVVLSRSLGKGSCDELGRAAAVVVVRWVHELTNPVAPLKIEVKASPKPKSVSLSPAGERVGVRVSEETPPLESEDAGAPIPLSVPVQVEVPTDVVDAGYPLTPTLSPPGEREIRGEVLGGGGLIAPGTPELAPALSLDLALVLIEHLRLNLAGLFDFGGGVNVLDEAGLTRGRLTTRGGAILPGAAWCLTQPLRVCLGATAGLRLIQAEATGTFVFGTDKTTLVSRFTFGPHLQLAVIPGPFFLALDTTLLITPTTLSFEVQALPTRLNFPVVGWLFRLSVGFGSSL